jgi:putative tricarboxylic transport membrane protein
MRVADLVTAAAFILLGAVVIADALRLGVGWGSDGPKSGFFPFWLAVFMVAASLLILLQAVRQRSSRPFVTREQLRPVLAVLLPATGLVVLTGGITIGETRLLPALGLYVASALYLGFYMRWVGRHAWVTTVVLSIGIPLATFIIFERWFLVPMPKGPLEAWLGF